MFFFCDKITYGGKVVKKVGVQTIHNIKAQIAEGRVAIFYYFEGWFQHGIDAGMDEVGYSVPLFHVECVYFSGCVVALVKIPID